MARSITSIALFTAATALVSASPVLAGSGKDYFVQDYKSATPLHGYSGTAGSYYCDYQRLPDRKCTLTASGKEKCVIVGWTLRQHCY